MAKFVIGACIGNTTINAVILRGRELVAKAKQPTAKNNELKEVKTIIENVIDTFVSSPSSHKQPMTRTDVINSTARIVVGVPHFMNALVEQKGLAKVSVIRLCGSDTRALPPFVDYPERIKQKVNGGSALVHGGFECTKKEISKVTEEEITQKVEELWKESGIRNFVVCGVFSSLDNSQEFQAANVIRSIHPDASVTESHVFNYYGLLERENAAILNEALKPLCSEVIAGLRQSLDAIGFTQSCSLYLTQNDGTLLCEKMVKELPLLTVLSGPASSMRGAAFLSGTDDAVVVDIGETTTNVGMIKCGLPCISNDSFELPGVGVCTKLYHPIMRSISLGKGSIISRNSSNGEKIVLSETDDGASDVITTTDVAMATGLLAPLNTTNLPQKIDCQTAYAASMQVYKMIGKEIDAVKTSPQDVPVLLVGDGSVLVDTDNWTYRGVNSLQRTAHYDVANAVGAAVGLISGEYQEMVAPLSKLPDNVDQLIEDCITKAKDKAIANGASPSSLMVVEKCIDKEKGIYIKVVGDPIEDLNEEVADIQTDDTVNDNKEVKIEDNPFWPFENAHTAELDKKFGLPEPVINSSGEWVLSAKDVESVCTGATILGSGGGGSPTVGQMMIKHYINRGKQVRIINPFRLNPLKQGRSSFIAYVGSPTVMLEKGVSDNQTAETFTGMAKMLTSGMMEIVNDFGTKSAGGLEVKQSEYPRVHEANRLENVRSLENDIIPLDMRITSLMAGETGVINSLAPLVLGAMKDIPVLDADGSGRAFPKVEMFTPYIYGCTNYSSCVANGKGNVVAISRCDSAQTLEAMSRDICVNMGSVCGYTATPLTFDEVLNTSVIYSISKAWCFGRAVQRAKGDPDPVKAILESVKGKEIMNGKVIGVSIEPKEGFDHGRILIQGLGNSSKKKIKIITLNESLVVHYATDESTLPTKENVIVTTPTIIAVLDPEKGEAIPNEEIKTGAMVVVVALEANPLLLTEKALKVVGPRALGFDFDYIPINSGDSKRIAS